MYIGMFHIIRKVNTVLQKGTIHSTVTANQQTRYCNVFQNTYIWQSNSRYYVPEKIS